MEREYKDSGIEWIGRIPKEWKVKPHKRLMRKIKNLCFAYNGENILSLTTNGVIVRDLTAGGKMPNSFDGYQYVYPGNLLMCLFDIDVTPRCVGYIKNEGLTSPAYSHFKLLDGVYGPYYDYLLRYMDDEKCLLHLSKNLRSSLTEDDFGQILSIQPPIAEQQRIADYLDKKCGEIVGLISLQEQMIEQLTAYKQSVITEAVTKGLNPNAHLVPSGIDWIGDVPEGWKPMRMKYIGEFQNGLTYTPYDVCGPEGVLVLRSSNIQNSQLCFDDNVYVKESPSSLMVKKGDIIICSRNGSASLIGKCAMVDDNIHASFGAFMVRFRSNIKNKYAYYLISTVIPQYKPLFTTTTINQLTKGMLSSMVGVLPPFSEQQAIAEYLDTKCAEIDSLIALKQKKIETLKDYKKSIIYEAVTGKIEIV